MHTSLSETSKSVSRIKDDSIDLITEVRSLLINSGLMQNVINSYDNDKIIIEAKDKPSEIQRFMLNSYWNLQFMFMPGNTMAVRFNLVPDGNVSEWLRLFKENILPVLVSNSLPKRIH